MARSALRFACAQNSDESLSLLTKRLEAHFSSSSDQSLATNRKEQGQSNVFNRIEIANKYFTAQIDFLGYSKSSDNGCGSNDLIEDGIILVVDGSVVGSNILQAMNPIHDRAVESGAGELLRLCVVIESANSQLNSATKTPKEVEQEYSERVLWCLDRGYEYVPACDLSVEAVAKGHDERDKEGFARVVEAIKGTVWSSAVMEKQQQPKAPAPAPSRDDAIEDRSREYIPPSLTKEEKEEFDEREEKARESLMKEANEAVDDASLLAQQREEMKNERMFEEFEGAVREAARIRDMSRSGQLSDGERRQKAGDAALMLMDLMGRMGYDEDEDGPDDDESV